MPIPSPCVVPVVPQWQAEQARVDPEHWFAEHKFMQDEIDELRDQLAANRARHVTGCEA